MEESARKKVKMMEKVVKKLYKFNPDQISGGWNTLVWSRYFVHFLGPAIGNGKFQSLVSIFVSVVIRDVVLRKHK